MTSVLIADDHPLMLSGLESVLRGSRYQVVAKVRHGAEVLHAVDEHQPAILILDVKMPGQSGIEILKALRSRGDRRAVVLLTASLEDEELMQAMTLEANGIVLKEGAETLILTCLDRVREGGTWVEKTTLERSIDLVRNGGAPRSSLTRLAPREKMIAQLVSRGMRNKEIGHELGMTEGTVKVSLHRIYEKLGIENRVELAMLRRSNPETDPN